MAVSTFFPESIAAKIAGGLASAISVLILLALISSATAEQGKNKTLSAWGLAGLHAFFVVLGFTLPGVMKRDLLRERESTAAVIIDRLHFGGSRSRFETKIEYTVRGRVYRTQIDYDCGERVKLMSIEYAVRWPVFVSGEKCL